MVETWPRRDEVWLVSLDPTGGAKIRKARLPLAPTADGKQVLVIAPLSGSRNS